MGLILEYWNQGPLVSEARASRDDFKTQSLFNQQFHQVAAGSYCSEQ